jgi:hypothetical protein
MDNAALTEFRTNVNKILRAAESINANEDRLTEINADALLTLRGDLQELDTKITDIRNQVVVPQSNQWYKLAWYKMKAIPRFSYNRVLKLHRSSILHSSIAVPLPDPLARKEFFTLLFTLTIAFCSSCGAILVFYHFPGRNTFSQTSSISATDDNPITNTSCIANCMVDYSGRCDISSVSDKVYPKQIASFFATALVFLIIAVSSLSLVLKFVLYFPWSMLYIIWLVVYLFREAPGTVDEVELNESNVMQLVNLLPLLPLLSGGAS